MTLRDTAQQVLTEARDGIAWIALYKKGRSWSAEPFWPDYDEKAGTLTFGSDDLPRIHEILEADPNAVIVNGYESNLGDNEHMTRDTLTAFLRWQYEGQYSRLADHIRQDAQAETQPATARYLEQVEQADSLDELDTIAEAAANDDTLTSAEYEAVHAAALRKAQSWGPQNKREGITSSTGEYEKYAHVVAEAIRTLASKPDNLENLENYLAHNFGEWVEKYARYPETLAAELQNFANMDI